MSDSAKRIKLAEADALMKNGDKFAKKVRPRKQTLVPHIPFSYIRFAGLVQLEP
jgi:hypothetical protein